MSTINWSSHGLIRSGADSNWLDNGVNLPVEAAQGAADLASDGTGSFQAVGAALGSGAVSSVGSGALQATGAALSAANLASAGSGTASFVGAETNISAGRITTPFTVGPFFGGQFFGGEFFAAGAAESVVRFVGASIAAGSLSSDGSGTMVVRAVTPAELSSAGAGAAAFVGEEVSAGVIVSAAAYSAGTSTAVFVSPAVTARSNLIDGWRRRPTKSKLTERELEEEDLILIASAVVPFLQYEHDRSLR